MTNKSKSSCGDANCNDNNSVSVMYHELIRLYNLEMDSYGVLVSKCNGLILINGTVITLLTLSLIQLIQLKLNPNSLLFSVFVTVTYVLLVFSLFNAAIAYLTTSLRVIDAEKFYEKYHCKDSSKILDVASCLLAKHTTKIKETNVIKSKKIKYSISFLSIAVGLYIASILWALITHLS